jgi:Tfp pilus assembly protein PilN
MNMIKTNFIPENLRKERTDIFQDGFAQVPQEVSAGIVIAGIGFLFLFHVLLGLVAVFKVAHHQVLLVHWNSLATDKKALDVITQETQALQKKMFSLKPISSARGIEWGKLMNEISDSLPKGVWLREIRYDKDQVMIRGSAVSKTNDEVILAGNFVSALKEKPVVKEQFTGLQVDSIERRENAALSIVDFLLKAKLKVGQ